MSELKERLDQISGDMNAKIRALNEEIKAAAEQVMVEATTTLFDNHPIVEEIWWTQYTPYFNDGNACKFGVGEMYYRLTGDDDACDYEGTDVASLSTLEKYKEYSQDRNTDYWETRIRQEEIKRAKWLPLGLDSFLEDFESLQRAVDSISEDVMKATFGDHVRVSISRNTDGKAVVSVDDYDHD
jgi:hypothetical protein